MTARSPGTLKGAMTIDDRGSGKRGEITPMGRPRSTKRDLERYAGLSIALPPLGLVALVAFVFLIVRTRAGGERKYEGLRVLR